MSESRKVDSKDTTVTSDKETNKHEAERKFGRSYPHNSSRDKVQEFRKIRSTYRSGYGKRSWTNVQQNGKRKKLEVGIRLKECDVGITEFIGDTGFFGVIKERYTDFQVNEIALDGQIAKLTNQNIPADAVEMSDLEDLKKDVSEEIWDQLQALKENDSPPITFDVTDLDKNQRRAIHFLARKITDVVSTTDVVEDEKKVMTIARRSKEFRRGRNAFHDNRIDWKQHGGEYCHFVLHKVNMDTMDALNQLAMNLRMKPNNFNYAGTKDRRAWTTQWVCLRKVNPSEILRGARNVRGAFVGNFKIEQEPLKLGMLKGNHFRIALRNVTATNEDIEKTMVSLRDYGFINYYGLQRFGTVAAIPTYDIGKTLLQGKWNEAIELILKPREGEQDTDLAEARKIYGNTKDALAAYKVIKRTDKIEAILLKGLTTAGANNPQGALDLLPRNTRLMYIHAYQSFVWNHMVSRRIKEFGKKLIVGDLVYENNEKDRDNDSEDVIDDNEKEKTTIQSNKNTSCASDVVSDKKIDKLQNDENRADTVKVEDNNIINEKCECDESNNLPNVKILKEEDLANYTLADILMPQVGWKVTYPPYAKQWFEEFLAKDDLTTDLRQKNKKYSLGGAYRKILQIPSNLSWKCINYKEKHSDLIRCDIDEMKKLPPIKDDTDGQYKALILEITLKSSTYATMALREILKIDTSAETQAAQSIACNLATDNTTNLNPVKTEKECESTEADNTGRTEEKSSTAKIYTE